MNSVRRRPRKTWQRLTLWSLVGVVLIVVVSGAWVGVRAVAVKNSLQAVVPLSVQIQKQLAASDFEGAQKTSDRLAREASLAASYSADPVWRSWELLPFLGANLTAVRTLSATANVMATQVVGPLTHIADTVKVKSFLPKDGRVDFAPLTKMQPEITKISEALHSSAIAVHAIDASRTISLIGSAKNRLYGAIVTARDKVDTVKRASTLIPLMLGSAGPRNYLLLIQNPAELRASGGIPGAFAVIHTENGHVELAQQASTTEFHEYKTPVLPLSAETVNLYGAITGQYVQNVTLTPRFELTGQLAQEMWRRQTGMTVDGVLSVDPIMLSYLLTATGPITLETGDVMTSENAVTMLLSGVYERYRLPADQDKFFASAAKTIFGAVASGKVEPTLFITALARAGDEHRVKLWSAHKAEQSIMADTTLAGGLPGSTANARQFGVYLNDATGAKMDYYLSMHLAVGQKVCREDLKPNYTVKVTLTNTAPLNAATSLRRYVTGGGDYGVPPGDVRTNILIYAPRGVVGLGVSRDGLTVDQRVGFDTDHEVALSTVQLSPGQTTVLQFTYVSETPSSTGVYIVSTPIITLNPVTSTSVSC